LRYNWELPVMRNDLRVWGAPQNSLPGPLKNIRENVVLAEKKFQDVKTVTSQ
jgi:hypothetical protein